jgi:hypothetical protein
MLAIKTPRMPVKPLHWHKIRKAGPATQQNKNLLIFGPLCPCMRQTIGIPSSPFAEGLSFKPCYTPVSMFPLPLTLSSVQSLAILHEYLSVIKAPTFLL